MFEGAFDTNVLIDFLHASAIDTLAAAFGSRAYLVQYIRDNELSKGIEKGLADPCVLNGERWITAIDDLDTDEYQMANDIALRLGTRHTGEAQTIAVCYYRKLVFCSRDDVALRIAQANGVQTATTTEILQEMIIRRHLSFDAAVEISKRMQPRGIDPKSLLLF